MATRAWVAGEVGRRLGTILTAATIAPTDDTGNLLEPIDDALRMLGYAEDDLATAEPDNALGFLALVKYTTLKAALVRLSQRFDLGRAGVSLRLQQTVATLERMIAAAEKDVLSIYKVMPSGVADDEVGVTWLNMGYLTEPTMGVVSRDWPYTTVGVGDG